MADTILYDVSVEDGKYRFIYHSDGKSPEAYRHGERWPVREQAMVGDKAFFALVAEIDELQRFRDAVIQLAVCSIGDGILRGFVGPEDLDDDNLEAWELVADVIEPIVRKEDQDRRDRDGYTLQAVDDDTGEVTEEWQVPPKVIP